MHLFHHAGGTENLDGMKSIEYDVADDQPIARIVWLSGHEPTIVVGSDVERLQIQTDWRIYANTVEAGPGPISPNKNRDELLAAILNQGKKATAGAT